MSTFRNGNIVILTSDFGQARALEIGRVTRVLDSGVDIETERGHIIIDNSCLRHINAPGAEDAFQTFMEAQRKLHEIVAGVLFPAPVPAVTGGDDDNR